MVNEIDGVMEKWMDGLLFKRQDRVERNETEESDE